MRYFRDGSRIQCKTLGVLLIALQLAFAQVLVAQDVDLEAVPPRQAQDLPKALIPRGKKNRGVERLRCGLKSEGCESWSVLLILFFGVHGRPSG